VAAVIAAVILLVLVGFVAAVAVGSGATLAADSTALARVSTGPFAGSVGRVQGFGPHREALSLAVSDGRLTPLSKLSPGERVTVNVQVRRPGWLSWALGKERTEQLTIQAPVAQVSDRWITVPSGSAVNVRFDQRVSEVAWGTTGSLTGHTLAKPSSSVFIHGEPSIGSVRVAAAPRSWEKLGRPVLVSWFPPSRSAVMVSYPAAGSAISPSRAIHLTFSKPVSEAIGSGLPRIYPSVAGRWKQTDTHTLAFYPAGFGLPLGSQVHIQLPRPVATSTGNGISMRSVSQIEYTVPPGSTLRLQQLLAEAGYLPVDWQPSGAPVARTPAAQTTAAVSPPRGSFSWRFSNTPHQLVAMWTPGTAEVITKGAVMKFENTHEMTADGVAGPAVWHALIGLVLAGKRPESGYSYVYVHREVPETMTLWHNGGTVLVSPANTGIAGAETALGTYPVFEHIPEGTMSGTNPDGSKYEDPGIKWISYFNGGDALHNFDRASFGSPQSLGCVELPLAASAEIWPYTPIGTLVTIET
jgi:hypothetical protein